MRSQLIASILALAAQQASAHSLFQQLWVDGVDQISPHSFFPLMLSSPFNTWTNVSPRLDLHPYARLQLSGHQCRQH